MNLQLLTLLIVALTTLSLEAQTVSGVFQSASGQPIANVTLDFSGGTIATNPTSGVNGAFNTGAPPGTYDIDMLPPTGYAPIRLLNVTVPATGTNNLGTIVLRFAGVVTGTVTNSAGVPLASANMDVYDALTGEKYFTPGDNTNVSGIFSMVVPLGPALVRAKPPVGQILVAQQIGPVTIGANTNVGTMVLPNGFIVSGTVRNAATSLPIADVDVDVDTLAGQRIITPSDNTNASGVFSVIVPAGTYNLSFAAPPGVLVVGTRILNVGVTGTTTLNNITMATGFALSGTVFGPGGVPVAGADLDVDRVLGNVRLFTPNDSTAANGNFSIVVPAGTYTLTVEPAFSTSLVGARVTPITVTGASVNLGAVNLQLGVLLSGTLTGWNGAPEANADIDVIVPSTLAEVVTPSDATAANGTWAVLVPNGTYTVRFQTAKASLSRDITVPNVNVNGPTVLNWALTVVPVGLYLGQQPQGAVITGANPVVLDALIWNPNVPTTNIILTMLHIDAAGVETFLVAPTPLAWPGQTFLFFPSLAVPLPTLVPSHSGLPHRIVLRLVEPSTNLEIDSDTFSFLRL